MQRWTNTTRALFLALAMIAAACGSGTTTTTGADAGSGDEMSDDTTGDDGMGDGSMDDDGMDDGSMGDDDMEHEDDHDDGADHDHGGTLDIADGSPVPSVSIAVGDDLVLRVSVENFTITAENIDGEPIENEGHMHLLVDGVKVDRFTELERDLSGVLGPGMHSVEVELNANDHRAWAVDGERIRDSVMVDVPGAIEETAFVITATYQDGTVAIAEDRVEVPFESEVLIQVTSDVSEELHVHGYDVYADIDPETGGQVRFVANIPGTFEVEFEQSGTFIVELIVRAT